MTDQKLMPKKPEKKKCTCGAFCDCGAIYHNQACDDWEKYLARPSQQGEWEKRFEKDFYKWWDSFDQVATCERAKAFIRKTFCSEGGE